MRFFRLKTALFSIIVLFASCSGDDKQSETKSVDDKESKTETTNDSDPAAKLEGAWEIMRAEGKAVRSNLGTVYTFKGDELTMGKNGFNNLGKTEITDSTFSFQTSGNGYKFVYHYHFNGDTLVASMENSNGQYLYMIRK